MQLDLLRGDRFGINHRFLSCSALTAATFCKAVNGNEIARRFPSATSVESRSPNRRGLFLDACTARTPAAHSFVRSLSTRYHDGFARCVRLSDTVTGDSWARKKDRDEKRERESLRTEFEWKEDEGEWGDRTERRKRRELYRVSLVTLPQGEAKGRDAEEG